MIFEEFIEKCRLDINPSDHPKIIARVNVDIGEPPIIIKGFTIKNGIDNRSSKPCIYASAPSFQNRYGKSSPIIFMPEELWKLLTAKILSEYRRQAQEKEDFDPYDPMLENM